jgi:hypothetical protein
MTALKTIKSLTLTSIVILTLVITECKTKSPMFYSEVKFIADKTVTNSSTFEVNGYGPTKLAAEDNACKNLFMALFFRGIAESTQIKPLIGTDDQTTLKINKPYFDSFFGQKRFLSFISFKSCSNFQKEKKNNRITCKISVNIPLLRQDLKTNKILSDYGF